MPWVTVRYAFTQRLPLPPRAAFAWCTDFRTDDLALAGRAGRRAIRRLTRTTLVLRDTVPAPGGRSVSKDRLVHLDADRLSWTNTHVRSPVRHSQFLYEIRPAGRGSRLEFRGAQLERWAGRPTPAAVARRASELRREDQDLWRRFARAMAEEARGSGGPRSAGSASARVR